MRPRYRTGIDDSSYPGLYSLLSDRFGPRLRGKVTGLTAWLVPADMDRLRQTMRRRDEEMGQHGA